jgi:hypothetical protein
MARAEIRLADVDPKGNMKPAQLFNFVRRRLREVLSKKAAPATKASKLKRLNAETAKKAVEGVKKTANGHANGAAK